MNTLLASANDPTASHLERKKFGFSALGQQSQAQTHNNSK
jgi:hypothetical protein